MSPEVGLALFLAGIVALGCAFLGGLYLLIRHEPMPTNNNKPPKKIVVSNLK